MQWLVIEGFILFNVLLFMLLFSFVSETVGRRLSVMIGFAVQQYFTAKKQYLIELSKEDLGERERKNKYN
jgi:hypothetical protein